ncbi:MAG: hypothetical protein M3Y91_18300, partial [Actinomycetota bacterium]|nr:hypothetical protein [Actinomycetota bacterium]
KKALFSEVFMAVQRRLVIAVARRSSSGPAVDRLRDACHAYLEECTPSMARIVLLDGPSVLGDVESQRIEDRLWLRALRDLIDNAQRDGRFVPVDRQLAARVISAAITQLATAAVEQSTSTTDVQVVLLAMLRGFEIPE